MKKNNSITILIFSLLCLSFLSCMTMAMAAEPAASIPLEQRVRHYTLDNGLQILLLPRHISPTVSMYIRYRAGAVDERDGKTGTAHFLEHMMFKGTPTIGTRNFKKEKIFLRQIEQTGEAIDRELRKGSKADQKNLALWKAKLEDLQKKHKPWMVSNEIDRLYTENGATGFNASTGQDMTTYHVNLPANKIELWARIESDRMRNIVYREFYRERNVIMEERRQRIEADPDGKLYEEFLSLAFTAHPYRRPIIGWSSDIQHLSMKDLAEFFRLSHAPNNTVIAIVGDIDPEKVFKIIKTYFGPLRRQPVLHMSLTPEPRQAGEKRTVLRMETNPQMIIGYHKPPPPEKDDYIFDVIESILSRGRTSRFYKSLVEEKGLAESVQASNGTPGSRYANLFAIFATPRHPHKNGELEAAVEEMIDRLKREPVSEHELTKVKNQVRADFIRQQRSNQGLAGMLSSYQCLLGDYRYMTTYVAAIEKITADDILRVAKTYLNRDNRTVAQIDKE